MVRQKESYSVETSNVFADLLDSDASSDEEFVKPAKTADGATSGAQANNTKGGGEGTPTRGGQGGRNRNTRYAVSGGRTGQHVMNDSMPNRFRGGRGGGRGGGGRGGGEDLRDGPDFGGGERSGPGARGNWNEAPHGSDEELRAYENREGRKLLSDRPRGRGAGQTRHREKDRHMSGTNRGRGMKKGGGGAHNWGNQDQDFGGEAPRNAELAGESGATRDWNAGAGATAGGWDEFDAGMNGKGKASGDENEEKQEGNEGEDRRDDAEAEKVTKPKEPEPIDYDEYMRLQAAKRANLPRLPTAAAEKAPGATQRSDLEKEGYTLHVKQVDPDSKGATNTGLTSSGADYYHNRKAGAGGGDLPLEAELISDLGPSRPRSGGRGGRGRGRGRGGGGDRGYDGPRDGGFDGHPVAPRKINLSDTQAFPCLG